MGIENDSILEVFIYESYQLIDKLEEILIEGEESSGLSKESINEVFRCMHTLKGSSAMMSYNNISSLTHAIEDLFAYIRDNENNQYNWSEICDLVLDVVDFTKGEINKIEQGNTPDRDERALSQKIRDYIKQISQDEKDVTNDSINKYKAHIFFEEDCKMENMRAFGVVNSIQDLCIEVNTIPKDLFDHAANPSEEIMKNGLYIFMKSEIDINAIKEALEETLFLRTLSIEEDDDQDSNGVSVDDKKSVTDDLSSVPSNKVTQSTSKPVTDENANKVNKVTDDNQTANKQSFISVNVGKLDKLLDLVGELVIAESMLGRVKDDDNFDLQAYEKNASQLHKITEKLQDVVMQVRMVPIASTFNKMHRLVRDMCKKTGKDVKLIIRGEQTEVDKNIVENLSDPLMHIIRNSIDHGIEEKEERLKLNKPAAGRVLLEAYNNGSEVYINVVDDGTGLDKDKIIEKAKANGVIKDNVTDLSDKDAYNLIMLPGFSTNEKVTEFSGRGVGMDVVKKSIEKIGGSVIVDSEKHKGTAMTLKIPLTLAIMGGMCVSVGKQRFIIPTLNIREAFVADDKNLITEPSGDEYIMLRGKAYPLIRLHKVFKIDNAITEVKDGRVVFIDNDSSGVCIFLDNILEEQQIVFKPLPEFIINKFGSVQGISGCTILGDGSVCFVLDTNTLSDYAKKLNLEGESKNA